MGRRKKRKEWAEKRRRIQGFGIVGGILAVIILLLLIGIATRDNNRKNEEEESTVQSQDKKVLLCDSFSCFSGQYVEDGSDMPVENVAAMLVTNNSDSFLDFATIEYEIDGKSATFVVTGLPAGKSTWVMEKNKMTITREAEFKYVTETTAYKEGVISSTDKITLYADGNMLTAVNNTDEKLEGVFVYYKTIHTDGNYIGGITYMTTFGDLEPGEKRTELAGHYDKNRTEIVRIGWKEN